jgi:hypothetical protein
VRPEDLKPADLALASRKEILAASAPWLAACLNLFPGLGTGYIYQRRWRSYWMFAALASLWVATEVLLNPPALDVFATGKGLEGLLVLAGLSAVEAFLAGRRARMT